MLEHGAELDERRLDQGLSEEELDRLIGDRDYRQFLNLRNKLYKERGMAEHPPSRAEALRLMAQNPNLVRRPIAIKGNQVVLGYDERKYIELVRGL